jgi:hypothetical protein
MKKTDPLNSDKLLPETMSYVYESVEARKENMGTEEESLHTYKCIYTNNYNQRKIDTKLASKWETKSLIGLLYFGVIHSDHLNTSCLWARDRMNSELLHMMSPYKRDVSLFYSGV